MKLKIPFVLTKEEKEECKRLGYKHPLWELYFKTPIMLYLALLTWILEIAMFASIIFIPIIIKLRWDSNWFRKPFETAYFW